MGHQEYSSEFKNQVVQFIIGRCVGIVPPRGTLKEAQLKFRISLQTCTRWWNAAKKQQQRGQSMQLLDRILNKIKFRNMYNTIHIDEKWFYMTKGAQRFYLAPGEEEPHRTLCRPLFGVNGEVLFDEKIGIFPFTKQVPAKRSSKNRMAGTLETKSIESITKDVTRDCLINKILPAIKAKWPDGATKVLKIQQDNARPHIKDNDPAFKEAAQQSGFSISLVQQPPNSPDTNVNDLGWFRAIQSLQTQTACKNVDDLVNAVVQSFNELQPQTLDNVFLSLQGCFMEIMKVQGHNTYKLPHMGKAHLRRTNQLPKDLEVPVELAMQTIAYLRDQGSNEGLELIAQSLGL
ncbi:uncharacterized protein LOC121804288 [Salvia splendens]|uniref:uncharacterized protein LOC121804288 n=1 Tax=Salvia splendens TaxID=180675 RepID=UPI001C270DD1|nr:uncharacterized protein LOC121804288 [Salvia splendens]